jgi:hypothetical protein
MTATAWGVIVQAVALLALVGGGWKYFDERRRDRSARMEELAWRKTQFIVDLAQSFDRDEATQVVLGYLAGPIQRIYNAITENPETAHDATVIIIRSLDRYFDFFDRLNTYVNITKTLAIEDVMCFSGYLDVLQDARIRDYVEARGYQNVVSFYDQIRIFDSAQLRSQS